MGNALSDRTFSFVCASDGVQRDEVLTRKIEEPHQVAGDVHERVLHICGKRKVVSQIEQTDIDVASQKQKPAEQKNPVVPAFRTEKSENDDVRQKAKQITARKNDFPFAGDSACNRHDDIESKTEKRVNPEEADFFLQTQKVQILHEVETDQPDPIKIVDQKKKSVGDEREEQSEREKNGNATDDQGVESHIDQKQNDAGVFQTDGRRIEEEIQNQKRRVQAEFQCRPCGE